MKIKNIFLRITAAALAAALCALCLFSCSIGDSDVLGDCNGDGKANALDSNYLARFVLGEAVIINTKNADVNGDGLINDADRKVLPTMLSGEYLPGERFSQIYLNNVPVSDYAIVIGENATDFEAWTAEILRDTLKKLCGAELSVRKDSKKAQEYEILIGETNRPESSVSQADEGKYLCMASGQKIVLKGKDYLVGAGAGYLIAILESAESDWNTEKYITVSTESTQRTVEWVTPENIFYFIGDGMGLNHTLMATDSTAVVEYADGTIASPDEKAIPIFWPSTFDHIGDAVTLNIQQSTTDSAAGATALSTGYKTLNGALGMVPADLDGDGEANEFRSVQNVREVATMMGKATAVLSTDKITGATPNAFLIHHYTRKDKNIIKEQQKALESSRLAPNYLWCSYDSDDILSSFKEAVDKCDDNPGGFFIMTEEGMIDKYSEKQDYDNALRAVKRLNKLTAYAATYAMCHRDTVIVITADHETGALTRGEDGVWRWTSDGEHTALNVPVFAMGYGTEYFHNTTRENTEIAKFIFDAVQK